MISLIIGGKKIEKIPGILRHIYTLLIVLIGWVLFRLEDFSSLIDVLNSKDDLVKKIEIIVNGYCK